MNQHLYFYNDIVHALNLANGIIIAFQQKLALFQVQVITWSCDANG